MALTSQELDRLEEDLKTLRIAYEKYFAGVERLEPVQDRTEFKTRLRHLKGEATYNTALRFRLQSVQASLVTHEVYWNRICREIEEGTYRRDRMKLRRRLEGAAAVAAQSDAAPSDAAETKPAAAVRPTTDDVARAVGVALGGTAGGSEVLRRLRSLHEEYVEAQRTTGSTSTVSLQSLAKTVAKQTAAIKQKYKCKDVEFRVAVKDGKAILKAIPR